MAGRVLRIGVSLDGSIEDRDATRVEDHDTFDRVATGGCGRLTADACPILATSRASSTWSSVGLTNA